MPPLDRSRNHRVSLPEAAEYTRRFRQATHGQPGRVLSVAFLADQVRELLGQPGCAGLRIYHGRAAGGDTNMVLVGVDESGQDMTQATLLQQGWPCPPYCPDTNELNS